VSLGQIGSQLANLASDFDPRTYGFKKLSDLVRHIDALELKSEAGHLRVRPKPKPAKARSARA
jgi:Fe-S-cluster formation regulator IscX/YfhJ